MKTYVIGDVHGCFQELREMIKIMGIKLGEDRLILLGDYIDRGNEEHEVLELLQNLLNKYGPDKVIPLMGNHEQMLLDSVGNRFMSNNRFSEKEIEFIRSRPVYFEDESWFYVHGGINPMKELSEQDEEEMLWIRDQFYSFPDQLKKKVAFGHTPTRLINGSDVPVVWNDRIALDTGCVFGGNLSAMELIDGDIVAIYSVNKTNVNINRCAA